MPRYKLTIEYDGGPFVGWQRQDNGLGVQEVIENAVQAISGQEVRANELLERMRAYMHVVR